VPPEDYFEHAPRITRLTGGVYRIHDWHSYLGFLGAGTTGAAPAIMGTAGKFTRIVYLPSVAVPVIDALPAAAVTGHLRLAARRWLRRYREPTEIVRRVGLEGGELASSLARLCDVPGSAWSRLRFLFVGHRARHFTGLGVHLAAQSVRCAAPYLDARWVGAAARLPTVDCRYESFHRTFIHELHPELAALPTEREPSVARRLPWPGQRRKSLRVSREAPSYSPFRRVLELPACQALLLESEDLDSHATREQRARALERRDVATCNLLLTLHFAGAAARESTR
jgi:hypothetical protein